MEYYDIMKTACDSVDMDFNEKKYNKFMEYKTLIKEWNEKVNLTAITEDEQIIKKHFIDCIKIYKFDPIKSAKSIIDIGTGAGFPGIPMKIMVSETKFVLLDSLNKRVNFLKEVSNKLSLDNINFVHGRAEDFAQMKEHRESYDISVSRAVANLSVLAELCIPYVKVGGYFIAMKGPSLEEELNEAKKAISILGGSVQDIIEVEIEDSDLKHNLLVVKKIKSTPKQYPRKPGTSSKNPLK